MLRPSAFQNNGNSETASSSKSILRPSSFQLAPSSLSSANESNSKNECSDEPSTTSHSDSPFELKDDKQIASTSNEATASTATTSTKEDDSKISSTTSNDGENSGENSNETKVIPNPFNNSKIKNADLDDETEAATTKSADSVNVSSNQQNPEKKTDLVEGTNLFATNTTKGLFASAASKTPFLAKNNSSENNFVFGQNIHERIVGVPDTSVSSASSADDNQSDSSSGSKLFAVSSASTSEATSAGGSSNGNEPKESSTVEDLTKVAREYEESRAQKRKLDAVETFTGEENEVNVMDMSCRLFAFVASNWEQRGPGSLRLNDVKSSTDDVRSRVVFRTLGNFRVLLNTKVWGGMVVEKPSQKSLRLTAIDSTDGSVKIYLVMARPDDISSLYSTLKKRIETERKREKTEESTSTSDAPATDPNTSKGSNHETDEQPESKKERKS